MYDKNGECISWNKTKNRMRQPNGKFACSKGVLWTEIEAVKDRQATLQKTCRL